MTPLAEPSKPIVLGMGWPTVDEAAVKASVQPQKSVLDLQSAVSDLGQQVTTKKQNGQVSLDLSADVLFAVDQATLSPKAAGVIAEAAAQIKKSGVKGSLSIVGHADSNGSSAHNLDLSQRRAKSVAVALKKALSSSVPMVVSGKGETEPIGSNKTEQGRQLNRRVSITFTPKEDK